MVFMNRNTILRFVLRKKFVNFRNTGLWIVKITDIFCVVFSVFGFVLGFVSNDSGNPFVLAMCSIAVHVFCLFLGVKGN